MKRILLSLSFTLGACVHRPAPPPSAPASEVMFYDDASLAPPFTRLEIVECNGLEKILRPPAYSHAIRQALSRARKVGGDVIIPHGTVKASEAGGIDVTTIVAGAALGGKKAGAVDRFMSENTDEDQVFWYFIIGKSHAPAEPGTAPGRPAP